MDGLPYAYQNYLRHCGKKQGSFFKLVQHVKQRSLEFSVRHDLIIAIVFISIMKTFISCLLMETSKNEMAN